jgi:hypothetical protein
MGATKAHFSASVRLQSAELPVQAGGPFGSGLRRKTGLRLELPLVLASVRHDDFV